MKNLPIGVEDFEEIIEGGYYYVDKSLLIKDIMDLPGKIKLITRPRRFGKTLNMSMVENFFSLFKKNDLFEGLAIWDEKAIVKDNYHKWPVVFVSFKELKDTDWERAVVHMKAMLSEVALKYLEYVKNDSDRKFLKRLADIEAYLEEYGTLLKRVTRILHEKFGKKVILLIDEYDVPIEAAYTNRHKDPDYYDNMVAFMRNMLTAALKGNEYLEFGILTGVYRVAKESIFSGLNNLEVFTVFDNAMEMRFGFTEEEIKKLLEYYSLNEEDKKIVDEWYGGFRIGEYAPLYNPWSVIKYIKERIHGRCDPEKAAQSYWINTSSNDIIKEQVEKKTQVKDKLDALLEGKEVKVRLDPWLSLRELEEVPSGVWTLLASSGYLAARYIERKIYTVRIPNKEIEEFFKDVVGVWLKETVGFSGDELYFVLEEMLSDGKVERFKELLDKFIKNSLSYYDFGFEEPERVYKAFLLGMLSIAINGYEVESEMESGYGRLDVVIYPKERRYGSYAAIFEVKRADSEKNLEDLAKQALEQIKGKEYYAKMKEKGYGIIGFGIAFCGKKAMVNSRILY
ncbi:MAG: AAA family ATPase [Thermotogae bacterium]|nr:AAA family ATPase [Thermotogota bacterium]